MECGTGTHGKAGSPMVEVEVTSMTTKSFISTIGSSTEYRALLFFG
jgi:hypothetical protein